MSAIFTGAEAACEALEALGIRVIYGVPSQHNLALWGALARRDPDGPPALRRHAHLSARLSGIAGRR
ncbi:MAG: hypothetical protein ACKPE6_12845, partial [Gammaproteobacteria bacterium]